jgi:hypothetical protein
LFVAGGVGRVFSGEIDVILLGDIEINFDGINR